jgi:hypothetical protein
MISTRNEAATVAPSHIHNLFAVIISIDYKKFGRKGL